MIITVITYGAICKGQYSADKVNNITAVSCSALNKSVTGVGTGESHARAHEVPGDKWGIVEAADGVLST